MNTFDLIVTFADNESFEVEQSTGLTQQEAEGRKRTLEKALKFAGYVQDEWSGDWVRGEQSIGILVCKSFDEDDPECFPGGEIGRALAADSAAEYAKIAQQNLEDWEYENRPRSFYHGVEGRWNPEDGWIYEP